MIVLAAELIGITCGRVLCIGFVASTLFFGGCKLFDPYQSKLDRQYEIVRHEVDINELRIKMGLDPIWTYRTFEDWND